jgi:hypothetical protein
MSLFKIKDLSSKPAVKPLSPSGLKQSASGAHRLGKSLIDLERTIEELVPDQALQFATAGRWSMHQLLEYLLRKTGPCRVWMTTWTITEEPMRALLGMITDGLILELNAVLDYRIERRKPEAFQLANSIITRIRLTKCHAKVLVLENENWSVTILGSANFSKNPRIEAGVIFSDKKSADFHKKWINDVIDGKEVWRAK